MDCEIKAKKLLFCIYKYFLISLFSDSFLSFYFFYFSVHRRTFTEKDISQNNNSNKTWKNNFKIVFAISINFALQIDKTINQDT